MIRQRTDHPKFENQPTPRAPLLGQTDNPGDLKVKGEVTSHLQRLPRQAHAVVGRASALLLADVERGAAVLRDGDQGAAATAERTVGALVLAAAPWRIPDRRTERRLSNTSFS